MNPVGTIDCSLLAPWGVSPEDEERQDFVPDSPRGNAICLMVDASEIAFVTVFLASENAWAISGELVGGLLVADRCSQGGPPLARARIILADANPSNLELHNAVVASTPVGVSAAQ